MKPERAIASSRAGRPERASRPEPTSFVLGGVAFEICPAPGITWSMGTEHHLFAGAYAASPAAGAVHCVVSPAPELGPAPGREVRWAWQGDLARVETSRMRAELRRLSPGRYAATALVAPGDAGCSALVTALTGAVVSREGGFVLHAAGVELALAQARQRNRGVCERGARAGGAVPPQKKLSEEQSGARVLPAHASGAERRAGQQTGGRAVLFIGPSGAGKTTAANHCPGARWMARDRAAVYPTPLGWYVAGMPGGDVIDLARAPGTVFPLGGVLRIRQSPDRVRVERLSFVRALSVLRESTQDAAHDPEREAELLESLHAFAADIGVGELYTVMGADLCGPLARWMEPTR